MELKRKICKGKAKRGYELSGGAEPITTCLCSDQCKWMSNVQRVWVKCLRCQEIDTELPNETINA
ncbi:hypothetical protein E2C01_027502 [Portunus trituberculatus]|uniref:Uncharacterized protein n=1 Tax=Portunus trituberculatus TaxID=210409 RepID=A0A5B7EM48_PORTR|nr:hypothetical protein [Portunus trituberculatus]